MPLFENFRNQRFTEKNEIQHTIGFPTIDSNYAHRQLMLSEETNGHRKFKPKEEKVDGF